MTPIIFSFSVFIAGVLSFFSPCIFPLLPVYLGILLDESKTKTVKLLGQTVNWYSLLKTLAFITGLSTIFLLLGYGAGFLGQFLFSSWLRYLLGAIVILFGLHQLEWINLSFLQRQKQITFKQNQKRGEVLKAFLLGVSFSLGWSPCIGPVLSSVLALAASGGQGGWQGGLLMLVYSLGLAVPFLLIALFSDAVLLRFNRLKPHIGLLKKIGGFLIILMGLLLMSGQLNALANLLQ